MNKMDLNMQTPVVEDETRTGLWSKVKKVLIFAAPLAVILGVFALLTLMAITAPRPPEKESNAHPPRCSSPPRTHARRRSPFRCKAKHARVLKRRSRRKWRDGSCG
ncbi:MAG: hypothetical protein NVV62_17180 [Terricaulis sp.]|nr:hypothetical protein [Terricaulis sp.]